MVYATGIDDFMVAGGCRCLAPGVAHQVSGCQPSTKVACWWVSVHPGSPPREAEEQRSAAQLVDEEDWAELAARLANPDPAGDSREGHPWDATAEIALACLARGRLEGLRVLLADEAATLALPTRVLLADAAVRAGTITDAALLELQEELQAADAPTSWRLWMAAIRADFHAFGGESAGLVVALSASSDVDFDEADLLGRMAHARLRRLVGIVGYFLSTDKDEAAAVFEEAGAELASVCQSEEVLVTLGSHAYARASVEDAASLLDELTDIRDAMVAIGSDRVSLLDYALGWTAHFAGDTQRLTDCVSMWRSRTKVGPGNLANKGMNVLEKIFALSNGDGDGDPAALAEAAVRVATDARISGLALSAADALLDVGEAALVPGVTPPGFPAFWESPDKSLKLREILARHHLLVEPSDGAVAELHTVIGLWVAQERQVQAELLAIRAAVDCLRVGRRGDAQRFFEQSELHRSKLGRRLYVQHERRYDELLERGDLPGEIRMLGPDVVVVCSGREVRLSEQSARLVVLLADARKALTRDWIIDAMWPDLDYETGRKRLKVATHRLREAIEVPPGTFIAADRGGIALDVPGWRVDLWEFRDLAAGDTAGRLRAFSMYQGDLCFRQLAYDDTVTELRDMLRDEWLALGTELVVDGELDPHVVAARARELGIERSGLRAIH